MAAANSQPNPTHESVKEQAENLFHDLSSELKHEVGHADSAEESLNSPDADLLVRKHVMGLILILFALVAVMLIVGIGGIALFGHGHFLKP
jgi:hypothetical protein